MNKEPETKTTPPQTVEETTGLKPYAIDLLAHHIWRRVTEDGFLRADEVDAASLSHIWRQDPDIRIEATKAIEVILQELSELGFNISVRREKAAKEASITLSTVPAKVAYAV